MNSIGFRVRALLSPGKRLDCSEQTLSFSSVQTRETLGLCAVGAPTIQESSTLDLICKGLSSKEEAAKRGEKVKYALLVTAASVNIGVDFGPIDSSRAVSSLLENEPGSRSFGPSKLPYGLSVFEKDRSVGFSFCKERITSRFPMNRFVERFCDILRRLKELTPREKIALELVSARYFELSLMTRFTMLITAIESLTEECVRNEAEVKEIRELTECARKRDFSHSVRSAVGRLKYMPVGQACQGLLRETLGPDDAQKFKRLYGTRSGYLHDGSVPDDEELVAAFGELDDIVWRTLKTRFLARP